MISILHPSSKCVRPERMELLQSVARKSTAETEAVACDASYNQWLCNRPELLECDEAAAILAAELIGIWLGWREGGRPPYDYWPSSVRRPDVPEGLYPRKAA